MASGEKQILLYLGNTLIGDINSFAKNRHLSESLKSEDTNATADQFTFTINWKLFASFIAKKFDDNPESFLRVGMTRIVFTVDGGRVRFAGWLASRPARSGFGADQMLNLKFFEHFARLGGDVVCDPSNKTSPMRVFTNRPAHLYVQDLVNEYMARAATAGETLNWSFGTVNTLGNKTITYKDFQTVAKALCDAMNNTTGAGKFDVVFRTDTADFTHQIIDILAPRGMSKNIIVRYPSDGVYKLWSTDYEIEETNAYASELLVSGNGQVGDPATGEMTSKIATSANAAFVSEYCYWRSYDSQSNLFSQDAVQAYADKTLAQNDFGLQTPTIKLVGRPIAWGDADNEDNGLAIGDTFNLIETNDDGVDNSGYFRIIAMETDYDDNGVESVSPKLLRDTD